MNRVTTNGLQASARGRFINIEITALPISVLAPSAVVALKRTDVLFCCVDNAAARLATALLSVLYLKPLLDVGSGIFHHEPEPADDGRPEAPADHLQERRGNLSLRCDGAVLCLGARSSSVAPKACSPACPRGEGLRAALGLLRAVGPAVSLGKWPGRPCASGSRPWAKMKIMAEVRRFL